MEDGHAMGNKLPAAAEGRLVGDCGAGRHLRKVVYVILPRSDTPRT